MALPKELVEFFEAVTAEEDRVHETLQMNTGHGMTKARELFESHFNRKYHHGDNVKYDIARVNVILRNEGAMPLC